MTVVTRFLVWRKGHRYDDFFGDDGEESVAEWRRRDVSQQHTSLDESIRTENVGRRGSSSSLPKEYDDIIFMSSECVEAGYAEHMAEEEEGDEEPSPIQAKVSSFFDKKGSKNQQQISSSSTFSESNSTVKGRGRRSDSITSQAKTTVTCTTTQSSNSMGGGSITESGCFVTSSSFAEKRSQQMTMQKNRHGEKIFSGNNRTKNKESRRMSLEDAAKEIVKNDEEWQNLQKMLRESKVVTNEAVRAIAAPVLFKKAKEMEKRRIQQEEQLSRKKRSLLSSLVWRYLPNRGEAR